MVTLVTLEQPQNSALWGRRPWAWKSQEGRSRERGGCLETWGIHLKTPEKWVKHGENMYPIVSMYGIFIYIWVIYGANVGKYSIHGSYGYGKIN